MDAYRPISPDVNKARSSSTNDRKNNYLSGGRDAPKSEGQMSNDPMKMEDLEDQQLPKHDSLESEHDEAIASLSV